MDLKNVLKIILINKLFIYSYQIFSEHHGQWLKVSTYSL